MASGPSTEIFDHIASLIIQASSRLIAGVEMRRDRLLAELEEKKFEHYNYSNSLDKHYQKYSNQIFYEDKQDNTTRYQIVSYTEQDIVSSFQKQSEDWLQKKRQPVHLNFYCLLHRMLDEISRFGDVVPDPRAPHRCSQWIDYSHKLRSVLVIGRDMFHSLGKFHFESNYNRLYVVNTDHDCINQVLVFDAYSGKQIFNISIHGEPTSVTTSDSNCYVASKDNNIYRINHNNLIIGTVSDAGRLPLNQPSHIIVNPNKEIFVADRNNDRICVFDTDLNYKREVGGFGLLNRPHHIQFTQNGSMAVLDKNQPNCLHFFNKDGALMHHMLTNGVGGLTQVNAPKSFCLDSAGNIIVSDSSTRSIKIFSPDGEIIHKIGEEAVGSDIVQCCVDVIAFQDKIFVACGRPFNFIKIY